MKRLFYLASAFMFSCAFLTVGNAQTLLNELDVNPGGTDGPCEYVELKGTPGAAVENMHFVSIEGDSGSNPGTATAVITFAVPGPVLGSNGLLVVTGTQTCGTRTFPAGTTVAQTSLLDTAGGALQNGTNSFLFISSTTPITTIDYDTDNNGTLESLPAGATIVDGVSWSDGGVGDITYGTVLTAAGGTVGACTRFPGNTTPNSAAAWYAGAMTGTNDANTYSPTVRTANFPSDGALTPGAPNVGTLATPGPAPLDFNGDGKSDFVISRDASGLRTWYILYSGTTNFNALRWGIDTDRDVPADYDGDGKSDVAIWREGPQSTFYILRSSDGTVTIDNFGQTGDRPEVVRDYDGDGKADVAVYRDGASAGAQSFFYFRGSLNNPSGNITFIPWGTNGDVPTSGDFDGDGKGDFAIRRNVGGSGVFFIAKSGGGTDVTYFGLPTDAIVPGDFDGDGKTDLTAARPLGSVGNFYWLNSSNGTITGPVVGANPTTDSLACGDYDGDGKMDIAVWRSTDGTFYVRSTATGNWSYQPWGTAGDRAVAEWNVTGGN